MIQPQERKKGEHGDEDLDNQEEDESEEGADAPKKEEDVLDMPPPWSPKLFVNKEKFLDLCPNGEKTVF